MFYLCTLGEEKTHSHKYCTIYIKVLGKRRAGEGEGWVNGAALVAIQNKLFEQFYGYFTDGGALLSCPSDTL